MEIDLKDITVLYCEDEPQLQEITARFLGKIVKKVYTASNGKEGLDLFWQHRHQIDMVISDIEMPEMDGLEMAHSIKDLIPLIPIIITSAYSTSRYLKDALDLHVDKYLLKPLNFQDLITAMKQSFAYHELRKLYRDSLTGLYSCNALESDLETRKSQTPFALLKIDDFEKLSSLYGESMAKKILIGVAEHLQRDFGGEFECYKTGPNTFALLAKDSVTGLFEARLKAFSALLRHQGISVANHTIRLHPYFALTDTVTERTFELAQHALQRGMRAHRELSHFQGDQIEARLGHTRNLQWIRTLNQALNEERLVPYYQAIVKIPEGPVYKYEALLRYLDPQSGEAVLPGSFLEIAQRSNLYPLITRRVLEQVIQVVAQKGIRVAVNIAYADLTDQDTIRFIRHLLKEHPKEASLLEFEILESEKIDNYDIAREFIETVRPYGCKIGIDDFGKGYSNFAILEALHVDYVKIDGSIIKEIDRSQRQALVVEGIHTFCKKLGIYTIAERVSNQAEYTTVQSLGIEYAQGWYFSAAVPAQELPDE